MHKTNSICVLTTVWLTFFTAVNVSVGDAVYWVGSWATSPIPQDASTYSASPALSGRKLWQTVHLSAGGEQVRLRFDNTFGEKTLVINAVEVSTANNFSKSPVLFDGRPSVSIPAGALIWSDGLKLPVPSGTDLSVTIRFGDVPLVVTGHSVSQMTSYVADPATTEPTNRGTPIDHWFILDGVDVAATKGQSASIVTLGDSITDGYKSTANENRRWPDRLAVRLSMDVAKAGIGVLNEGISGNRLTENGAGPATLARLDRDVLGQTAVRWVVLLEGINDIGVDADPAAHTIVDRMELADRQIIARCHAHQIKVYAATILPFNGAAYSSPEKDQNRQRINDWIRTSEAFDAVIDFDAAIRDVRHPDRLATRYDSGDNLHPNDAGYQHLADSVDLNLFQK